MEVASTTGARDSSSTGSSERQVASEMSSRPAGRAGGLGRGLSALLPDEAGQTEVGGFQEVPLDRVRPNPRQPRDRFDEDALGVLADSIGRVGVLQPLVVQRVDGMFELIAGERRLRAARRAGLTHVPVFVRSASDLDRLEQALFENVHREDLNPLEEAAAFRQLIDDFSLTHEDVAVRVGRSRAAITNSLRLLGLPGEVQELLADGSLSSGHARALLALDDRALQVSLSRRIVAEDWSVRSTERAVKRASAAQGRTRGATGSATTHPALLEVGDMMGDYLDTRVEVKMGQRVGRMVIEFGSLDDLRRITDRIFAAGEGGPGG